MIHLGQLLHEDQILSLTCPKYETVLLVQVAQLQPEGDERSRDSLDVSGRIGPDTEMVLNERRLIPFNHEFRFDDEESVDLRDSDCDDQL